jgi:hypothetical protein
MSPGFAHRENCDVARCMDCGGQRLMHELPTETLNQLAPGAGDMRDSWPECNVGSDIWTGEWPGVVECVEYGWYAKFIPGEGWIECSEDDPEGHPDLNRLMVECTWSKSARRYVKV